MESTQTMKQITQVEAFKAFARGELDKLDFLPAIQDIYTTFTMESKRSCCAKRQKVMTKYNSIIGDMLREAGALYIPKE